MNIFTMDSQLMDDMATDYLNGMYESQYEDEGFYPTERKIDISPGQVCELPDNNEIPFLGANPMNHINQSKGEEKV